MKKLFWVIVLGPFISFAQELDSTAIDTVEIIPPPYYLGAYLHGGITIEPSEPEQNAVSFLGIGVQYENWLLEFSRHDFQGTFQTFVVFPNTFELQYRYGGLSLAYQFYQSTKLGLLLKGSYFKGDMTWRDTQDHEIFFRDEFKLMKIGLVGELSVLRYFKPNVMVGYQNMQDIELTSVASENFSGLFFGVGIRIGYFNQ